MGKDVLKVKTPAKINLTLDVVSKREDGYHEMDTVMQTVSVFDDLIIKKTKEPRITLASNLSFLPTDGKNIVYKAVKLVFEYAGIIDEGVDIFIKKYIPIGAGLGGGSSNAAGAILGLNTMFDLGLSMDEMHALGAKIGADVPYCMYRGTYLARGIGDILTKTNDMPSCTIVIAKPTRGISTPVLFAKLDKEEEYYHPSSKKLITSFSKGVEEMSKYLGNSFTKVAIEQNPNIGVLLESLKSNGAINSSMSGSGSAVFGIFRSVKSAAKCVEIMRKEHRGAFVSMCSPIFTTNA